MRRYSLLIVVVLLLTGCHPVNSSLSSTAVQPIFITSTSQVAQGIPTVNFTAQAIQKPQPEQSSTSVVIETLEPILPEMVQIPSDQIRQESLCSTGDHIPVQNLSLSSDLGLLLVDGNINVPFIEAHYQLYIYQPVTGLPGKPLNLSLNKTMHSKPVPSPDGTLFYYEEYDKSEPTRTLVIESMDGQIRKTILEQDYPFGYATWIDNRHILWSDVSNPEDYWAAGESPDGRDYMPTHLIDVKTFEVQELPPIQFPDKYGEYYVEGFIHFETGNYAFLQYNLDQISFLIYSYNTQVAQPVFSWLPTTFLLDPRDTTTYFTNNGEVNLIAKDGNTFWIVSQVSIKQLLSGSNALAGHFYEFTYPEEIAPYSVLNYFSSKNAFLYIYKDTQGDVALETMPEYLHRFDVESQTAYDYCLDVQKWKGRIYVSPNEKFVAMTLYEDPMTGEGKKDTVIINLTTGARALLTDYQVFGWVTVE